MMEKDSENKEYEVEVPDWLLCSNMGAYPVMKIHKREGDYLLRKYKEEDAFVLDGASVAKTGKGRWVLEKGSVDMLLELAYREGYQKGKADRCKGSTTGS